MKKIALALVATSTIISATHANIGTGFYLGAHLGYGSTTARYVPSITTAPAVVKGSADVGNTAANIGIHGGYGWVTGCLYLGGEIAYTFENTKISNTQLENVAALGTGAQARLKRSGYFNLAVRGGYLFTPNTMMYIRLGGNWGKWTHDDSLFFGNNNPGRGTKNRLSFAPGVGLETAIHKNVYLRGEYVYEFGPSITATNANQPTISSKFNNIRSQSFKLGLSYKF
jgi:opacity protein-like surface antigen